MKNFFFYFPFHRSLIYLFFLGLFPLVVVLVHFFHQKEFQENLASELGLLCESVTLQNTKEMHNRSTRATYQGKDQFYLIKQLESMTLLEDEIAKIQKVLGAGFHPEEEACRRRLHFLTSGENSIVFSENPEKRMPGFTQTEAALQHPVEANLNDVKKIIARIEGVKIDNHEPDPSRPHLIISDFHLEKKKEFLGDVLVVNLKTIKREYIP